MNTAIEEFLKYTDSYKEYGKNIKRKIDHTLRVCTLCEEIAKSLNLSSEDIKLAKLAGLLHDIGRFEQYKNYQTFNDAKSIDHGNLGREILTDEFLEKYNWNKKNNELLRKVVSNHNKKELENDLSPKEKLICQIVRDADKVDIFYLVLNSDILELEDSNISDDVYAEIMHKEAVTNEKKVTKADNLVCNLAFVFDINFPKTLEIIRKKDYLNKLIDKYLDTSNPLLRERLLAIKKLINEYLKGA